MSDPKYNQLSYFAVPIDIVNLLMWRQTVKECLVTKKNRC